MSDLEHLTRLIEGILTGSNDTRNENEAILKKLRETDPNNYIMTFTNLLNASPHKEVRIFCGIHLRRNLSSFIDSTEQSCWTKLTLENQKALKGLLWEIMKKEENPTARKTLRELVGELAASIINIKIEDENGEFPPETKTWDDLMSNIWGLLSSENTVHIQDALALLSILFTLCMNEYEQYKDELAVVFKKTLEHTDPKVKAAAIDAFASFLKTADTKTGRHFSDLMPLLLQNTMQAIESNEDAGAEALSHITDIVEGEPKLFQKHFRDFFDLLKEILQKNVSQPLKEGALETLTMFCEKVHKFISKQPDTIIKEIFETVFRFMVIYVEEVTNEWLVPPEGFAENNEETDAQDYAVKFCMGLVDRLIVALGAKLALPILSGLLIEMMETNDWRFRFAALMALSQIGEYIEEIKELDPIVKFIMNFTQSDHPKVRYAALHAIGQIADDEEPEFQNRYLDEIFPSIINMLNDSVPRVVAHALAAMINLIQKASVETGMKYVNSLWEPLLALVQNGISLVREGAMGVLACLIAACEHEFTPYWEKTAEVVYNILKTATKREYKKLRGQAIECLTVTGLCIKKEDFMKVAHNIIGTMLEIQQNHIEEVDPQKSYLLLGWERMCSVMGAEFLPYVEKIVPPLLEIVGKILEGEVKKEKESEKKEEKEMMGLLAAEDKDTRSLFYQVNTTESEEAEIAINLIKVMVYQIKDNYIPYLEKTSEILTFIIDKSQNEDLRIAAADGLAGLIIAVKESKLDNREEIIKRISDEYLGKLWTAVKTEFEHADDISKLIISIKQIILASGRSMNEHEISEFNDNIFKVLKDSDTRKGINYFLLERNQQAAVETANQEENDDQFDDDEVEYLEEENDKEEKLHCAIAELMGAIFITYKELAMPLAQVVSQNIIPNVLNPTLSVYMNNFGLLLVNFMLESLGVDLIQNELQPLSEILVKYVVNKHAELRQTAARGIKLLAEIAKDNFQAVSGYCINALEEGLKIQKQKEEKQDEFREAKDQLISALGQIIKSQLHCVDQKHVVQVWLSNLPLKRNEVQARIQHELLVDLVLEVNATLVFGEKGENLPHVIKIFAEVLETRLASNKFDDKVGKIFQLLIQNENTKTILQEAISKLDKSLQDKLQKAFNKA